MSTDLVVAGYDRFYGRGGWTYDVDRERAVLATVARLAGWQPGDRVVEVGAGMGQHAELLRQAGYQVTAVEPSTAGCDAARNAYPDLDVVCAGAQDWTPPEPGHVYARGMSWWHYELHGVNRQGVDVSGATADLVDRAVAPGHTMVLQIFTDLSGWRPPSLGDPDDGPADRRIHHNTLADYLSLFGPLGDTGVWDWAGEPIRPGQRHDRGVIVVTRRTT